MFSLCPKLLYLDVSSRNNTNYYMSLSEEIPDNTTIRVHKEFVNKIRKQIPEDSAITIID